MSTIDIPALRALLEKATKGPFGCGHIVEDGHSCDCGSIFDSSRAGAIGEVFYGKEGDRFKDEYPSKKEEAKANLRLIVAALNALPALLDAFEERERMRRAIEQLCDCPPKMFWRGRANDHDAQ